MKTIKILWLLALILSAGTIQAQERQVERTLIPPDFIDTLITYTYTVPEVYIDSTFMDSLNAVLFDKKYMVRYRGSDRYFSIIFSKKKTSYQFIQVELDNRGRGAKGFFEQNGFYYWLGGDVPPNIIQGKTGIEKQTSYTVSRRYKGDDRGGVRVSDPYDPTMWFLVYNQETGQVIDDTY